MTTNYSLLILFPLPLLFPSFTGEEGAGWPGCWQPIITSEQSRNRQSHARGLKFSQDCRQEGTSEVSLPRSLFQSIHVSSIHPHFVAFPFGSDRPLLQFELQTLPSLTEVEVSVSSGSSVAVLFHLSVRVFGTWPVSVCERLGMLLTPRPGVESNAIKHKNVSEVIAAKHSSHVSYISVCPLRLLISPHTQTGPRCLLNLDDVSC